MSYCAGWVATLCMRVERAVDYGWFSYNKNRSATTFAMTSLALNTQAPL